ncbi:putative hydroxylase [Azotobacter vinelandii CA]|uniref:2-oxoglutarate and Fe(II)-dependent dioxygenase superfamily n=2 Tax=Azotobacter vinelandii TaxID=354 RepID=C1DQ09_AZOVD|nr:Fe2+-dependent dioxygenase [Azotobacter vinelandii]ACO77461.1 2-oxoglutarate and Fe(II)-dependent dioxygenase superfamily [Azotobacter vinelandii DJ]AGK15368.1 putative hydroxylase [Azotobacter vinelandii CA]AGK19808.1 putative hydroxylase [Azotobacter vinelandii CA6]WKN23248.1 Fe2+-dependent dioxygenase [Azotobacter vinelandii]SFX49606.1 PKHD-type hydroxylase [Azotobacter vinelandii]
MMLTIPDVLTVGQLRQCREALARAAWHDGRQTAGHVAIRAKANLQLAQDDPLVARLGALILERLGANPRFLAAALPLKVLPPRFNCYTGGGVYGDHIDNAVFSVPGTSHRVRSDLSATLFFCDPDEYDGGELVIRDTYGTQRVKLPAGHLALYPGTSLHQVTPVTRGARYAAFFWVQSLVRGDSQRATLLELDESIQALAAERPDSPLLERLTGVYHNLLRHWADT